MGRGRERSEVKSGNVIACRDPPINSVFVPLWYVFRNGRRAPIRASFKVLVLLNAKAGYGH